MIINLARAYHFLLFECNTFRFPGDWPLCTIIVIQRQQYHVLLHSEWNHMHVAEVIMKSEAIDNNE